MTLLLLDLLKVVNLKEYVLEAKGQKNSNIFIFSQLPPKKRGRGVPWHDIAH